MKANLPFLFDPTKYEKLKTPDQKQFEDANMELMFAMEDAVYDAHEKYQKGIVPMFRDGEMDKMMPAVCMISFIRQRFMRSYPLHCRMATNSRFRLVTDQGEYVYLKKLDKRKRPSNIQTENNALILFQATKKGGHKFPNVFFGYTWNQDRSRITGVFAVCIKGEDLVWATNISTLRDASGGIVATHTPVISPVLKTGVIKLKSWKQRE